LENLHWFGHDSFRLDGEKIIYFDPYQVPQKSALADIILVTHEHYDHCSPDDLKIISGPKTTIIASAQAAEVIKKAQIVCQKLEVVKPSDEIEAFGIKIRAVPAYNIGKQFHPKSSLKVGFIITAGGLKIYHAGDTDFIPEMKDCRADIALMPVSGTYTMNATEAADAVLVINPKIAVPMHYGSVVGSIDDAKRFQNLLKGKIEVKILSKES